MTSSGVTSGWVVGFKRHLRAQSVRGEGVYVLSERGVTALTGSHVEALAPLLDGTRDLPALVRDLPVGVTPDQLASVLIQLSEAGLVTMRGPSDVATGEPTTARDRALGYWEAGGLDPATAQQAVANRPVRLVTVGGVDGAAALSACTDAGLNCTISDIDNPVDAAAADLSVVLCDDYLNLRLADVDAEQRFAGKPWLLARPMGRQLWIGPVFEPADGACWHCLASRLWGHRQAEAHMQAALGLLGPAHKPVVTVAPFAALATHLISLEVTKWLAGFRYPGQQAVWTLDSLDLQGQRHEVRRRPQCAMCGDPGHMRAQAAQPVAIRSRRKVARTGGGHRSMPSDEVLERFRHLVSPVTGVIREINRDRRGPSFFNSFRAGPNLAVGTHHIDALRATLRAENGGKGVTALDGEVSALCEALERHSGYFHGDEERVHASFLELGTSAVHPDACQLFDTRQYVNRAAWNRAHSPFQFVCDPFDDEAMIDWTPVWSLGQQRHRFVPTRMVYYNAPPEPDWCSVRADSNGAAAGSSLEDAMLQGALELVERDAVALWWYNRTRQPEVDLDAFGDPWLTELREVYRAIGREVWVLDVTSDLGVPAMAALSRRVDKASEDIMFGFGAHFDPAVALRRALTEMNQLMPAVVNADENGYGWTDREAVRWWSAATIANQPYLVPDPGERPRVPGHYGYQPTDDLACDITTIQGRLADRGMDMLVLDQTRPDIGLPVVKVLVPGLRSMWARFAPGRLFDIPVRLGRCARPTAYADLNPIPLFI